VRPRGAAPRHAREPVHDATGDPAPGLDAHKKTLVAAARRAEQRAVWHAIVRKLDARRLVFVAERAPHTSLTPRYARAPKGQRA
jgi:hypothetical protein